MDRTFRGVEVRIARLDGQQKRIIRRLAEGRMAKYRMIEPRQFAQPKQPAHGAERAEQYGRLEHDRDKPLPRTRLLAADDRWVVNEVDVIQPRCAEAETGQCSDQREPRQTRSL